MKILENSLRQPCAYADSEGYLKIELEPHDNKDEIIKQYHKSKSNWADTSCLFLREEKSQEGKIFLIFRKHRAYLD